MTGQIIAPISDSGIDVPGQIAQIEALLNTDSIDCLSIEPPDSNAFTQITNQAIAMGIPVFTVGVTSNGNELTNFTQVPDLEGAQAATILLDWMAETGNDLKTFAVSGGDPTAFWAQGRMKSFRETIQAAIPDATFINTEENALATTFEEAPTYDAYMALIAGNPDLDFIENVDIGAEHAARADPRFRQGRRDVDARLERQLWPARRHRRRSPGRRARPEVVRAGRLRGTRVRRLLRQRHRSTQHPGTVPGHGCQHG